MTTKRAKSATQALWHRFPTGVIVWHRFPTGGVTSARVQARGSLLLVALLGLCLPFGCREDVRLAGKHIRKASVRTVTHYGVTLDQEASPKDVAYVLLRAIRDDFLAKDHAQREAALDVQFDICAANEIQRRNRRSLSRDEFIHTVVSQWTPTVSHYACSFETDRGTARACFVVRAPESEASVPQECEVLMEVVDPDGNASAGAVMVIYMVKDGGYWRVTHLGFKPARRSIGSP